MKILAICTGIGGFLAVALGAFGAHALRGVVDAPLFSAWQTAVLYQMIHVLVLLAILVMAVRQPDNRKLRVAGYVLAAGILIFSGSLYLLVLVGIKWLGAITPVGGVLLLMGWVVLSFGLVAFVANEQRV